MGLFNKDRRDMDTLIRPHLPSETPSAVPRKSLDRVDMPQATTPSNMLDGKVEPSENAQASDRVTIADIWQFSKHGAFTYPKRNQYWLWMIRPLLRPFDFTGRSPRMEYALYWLFVIVVAVFRQPIFDAFLSVKVASYLSLPIIIILIFPLSALTIRRMHDRGVSGWRILLSFVSFIGIIQFAADIFTSGERMENEHGPDPYGWDTDWEDTDDGGYSE